MKGLWELLVLGALVLIIVYGLITARGINAQLRILNAKADVVIERTGQ